MVKEAPRGGGAQKTRPQTVSEARADGLTLPPHLPLCNQLRKPPFRVRALALMRLVTTARAAVRR